MQSVLLLLTVLLSSLSTNHDSSTGCSAFHCANSNSCRLTSRIVNGMEASLAQFPHQVSLRSSRSKRHFCGGSIISVDLVMTAAHCIKSKNRLLPWMIVVVAGQLKLDEPDFAGHWRGVKRFKVHPQFDYLTMQNDIAILELAMPFKFTPVIRNVLLPASDFVPGTVCQVSGWGYTVQGSAQDTRIVSNDLMYMDVPIREIKECRELLVNITDMPAGMFCAGYLEGGRDACQGDSGGGMICNGVLTGVVSSGIGCALPLLPGLYSNVFHYRDWILNGEFIETVNVHDQQSHHDLFEHTASTVAILTIMVLILSCLLGLLCVWLRHPQIRNREYFQDRFIE